MLYSTVEINKLEEEIINLRNENQMLKEQLKQTNINGETIHNSSIIDEGMELHRRQLLNMLEPSNYETEDEYSNTSYENMKNGYKEMGNLNLEIANESRNSDLESLQSCEDNNYDEMAKAYAELQL